MERKQTIWWFGILSGMQSYLMHCPCTEIGYVFIPSNHSDTAIVNGFSLHKRDFLSATDIERYSPLMVPVWNQILSTNVTGNDPIQSDVSSGA
jgi:hypothetical protein